MWFSRPPRPRPAAPSLGPTSRRWSVLACAALACSCDDPVQNQPEPEHNPVPPTGNSLVLQHRIGGDPSSHSSIWGLLDAGDGTWFSYGPENDVNALRRLAADGTPIWANRFGYVPASVLAVSTASLPSGVVTVGSFDSNGDGYADEGRATLWGADGTRIDEIVLGSGVRPLPRDVAVAGTGLDGLHLVVVASKRPASGAPFTPWVVRVVLRPDSTLARGEERTYPALAWSTFDAVERDASGSGPLYIGGNTWENDSTIARGFVMQLSDSLSVDWRTDLVTTPGSRTRFAGDAALCWTGDNLIAVGNTEVVKNGATWRAALAVSLSPQGQQQWLQAVALTQFTELFRQCWVDGAYVYAAGGAANSILTDSRRLFGYGLLTRLGRADGAVAGNFTFGDPTFESGFNRGVVRGDRAWCGGWTDHQSSGGDFQSWFVDIDFTRPLALSPPPFAAMVDDLQGATPETSQERASSPWGRP